MNVVQQLDPLRTQVVGAVAGALSGDPSVEGGVLLIRVLDHQRPVLLFKILELSIAPHPLFLKLGQVDNVVVVVAAAVVIVGRRIVVIVVVVGITVVRIAVSFALVVGRCGGGMMMMMMMMILTIIIVSSPRQVPIKANAIEQGLAVPTHVARFLQALALPPGPVVQESMLGLGVGNLDGTSVFPKHLFQQAKALHPLLVLGRRTCFGGHQRRGRCGERRRRRRRRFFLLLLTSGGTRQSDRVLPTGVIIIVVVVVVVVVIIIIIVVMTGRVSMLRFVARCPFLWWWWWWLVGWAWWW